MTDRIRLNDLTADALDALYERLEAAAKAEQRAEQAEARVAELVAERKKDDAINAQVDAKTEQQLNNATEVIQYFKALAERTQAWGEQHRDRANRYRARTDAVTTECHTLNSETKGLNPFAMAGRRDAVARIRAALQTISHDTPVPDDPRVTALEAENARLRAAWTSARHRAAVYLQSNQKLSATLPRLHRCIEDDAEMIRHWQGRAETAEVRASVLTDDRDRQVDAKVKLLGQLGNALADKAAAEAAIERVRQIHTSGPRTDACNDCGQPWPCEVTRALGE
ncbi:hypothetical protein [Streptomyces sp. NPDC004728]|uniref:hypothetical protein n=1 Tax=Streptomyces sp. NPDC004728 TaxID=3154289 RepID=UPI0033B77AF0